MKHRNTWTFIFSVARKLTPRLASKKLKAIIDRRAPEWGLDFSKPNEVLDKGRKEQEKIRRGIDAFLENIQKKQYQSMRLTLRFYREVGAGSNPVNTAKYLEYFSVQQETIKHEIKKFQQYIKDNIGI